MSFENEEGVEEVDGGEGVDLAPAGDVAAWDGSLDTLDAQPWVPEEARSHIARHREEYTTTKSRTDFLDRMFAADDRTAELTKVLSEREGELASLKKALEDTGKDRDALRGRITGYESEREEAQREQQFTHLKTNYADIYADCHEDPKDSENFTGAWPTFIDLLVKGYSEDMAAKLARGMLAAPAQAGAGEAAPGAFAPRTRQVVVPPSVAAASRTTNSPTNVVNAAEASEDFDKRARRLENEARARGE
jgi:chromosome segregation ATPase